ncbi:MAG: TonB-dependent receptor, partial [Parahaliea sp.]
MKELSRKPLVVVLPLLFASSLVQAQLLEEVIVTAQKREQNAQDLAMSVSAFSGDAVQKLGIDNSEELVAHTVNFNVTSSVGEGSRPAYFMRGVGLNDFNTNNVGPVGVYLDEVYLSSIASQMVPLFDVGRVEILRGPQGTLFGRNTSAGAVSFYSAEPTEEFEGYVNAGVGNFGARKLEGAVGGAISDSARVRLSAVKVDSDGYIDNEAGPGQEGARDILAWRGQLTWDASENFDMLLNIHGGSDQSEASGYQHLGTLDPVTFGPCSPRQIAGNGCVDAVGYRDTTNDFYKGEYDFDRDTDSDTLGGLIKLNWVLGDITLTSITGYDEIDQIYFEDADAGPVSMAHVTYGVEAETVSQELRAVGSTDKVHWILGAYYMSQDLKQNQSADLLRVLRPDFGFDPDNFVFFSRHKTDQETESYALFGQVEYQLTERLTGTAGLRWTTDKGDFGYNMALEEPDFTIPVFEQSADLDDEDLSWRFAIDYQINDEVRTYASVTKGYKSGGFNGGFLFEPTPIIDYDPETLISYEVGLKGDYFDNTVRLNLAAFY